MRHDHIAARCLLALWTLAFAALHAGIGKQCWNVTTTRKAVTHADDSLRAVGHFVAGPDPGDMAATGAAGASRQPQETVGADVGSSAAASPGYAPTLYRCVVSCDALR